jgi:uncharacterized OB-fold protein
VERAALQELEVCGRRMVPPQEACCLRYARAERRRMKASAEAAEAAAEDAAEDAAAAPPSW